MDPSPKKKIGSLLAALESATNSFNLKELENEIVEILSPDKSETNKKKESLCDAPSTSKYEPGYSFVRRQENFIPGLSIPQETNETPPVRSGFGDGKFEHRLSSRSGSESKEKAKTDAFRTLEFRGRGGNFGTPRRYENKPNVKEEKPPMGGLVFDNRIPKPETDPFAERKVSPFSERGPMFGVKTEDTEAVHDRSFEEPSRSSTPHKRESSDQKRYFDRGGKSSSNRGYNNQEKGMSSRGGWQDRGGRGNSSNRGYENRGGGPSGSNRGHDNRGRPFNNFRGYGNRGKVDEHRGRRPRRRGPLSMEQQVQKMKEFDEKNAEVYRKIRERMGLSPSKPDDKPSAKPNDKPDDRPDDESDSRTENNADNNA